MSTVGAPLTEDQALALVEEYGLAVSKRDRMHAEYMGKAMTDQTYDAFATLRDDTIPALRKRLVAALASQGAAPASEPAYRTALERIAALDPRDPNAGRIARAALQGIVWNITWPAQGAAPTGAGDAEPDDGALPATLLPVHMEWYTLCERAPHAHKIAISGALAEAIVRTVVAAPQQATLPASEPVLSIKRGEWQALSPTAQEKLLAITGAGSRNLARAQAVSDALDKPLCAVPPEGWACSRAAGHDGPCACTRAQPQALGAAPVAYSVGRTLHWHEGRGIDDAQLYAVVAALAQPGSGT